jgi:hypothetical protein
LTGQSTQASSALLEMALVTGLRVLTISGADHELLWDEPRPLAVIDCPGGFVTSFVRV